MPKCGAKCPAAPGGATADPVCEFSATGKPPPTYCGLKCTASSQCPTGTSCELPTGICAYPYPMGEPEAEAEPLLDAYRAIEPTIEPACDKVLREDCGAAKAKGETECDECVKKNLKKEESANCTKREALTFCGGPGPGPGPTPSPDLCEDVLMRFCGDVHKDETACEHCVRENYQKEKAENCTREELSSYCKGAKPSPTPAPTPSPPNEECEAILREHCGRERTPRPTCERCLEALGSKTLAACTLKEEFAWCDATPVRPIEDACKAFLDNDCGEYRENVTACDRCVRKIVPRGRLYNCTREEEANYCDGSHPHPGPDPAPAAKCEKELKKECGAQISKKACEACAQKVGEVGDCTRREEFTFCGNHSGGGAGGKGLSFCCGKNHACTDPDIEELSITFDKDEQPTSVLIKVKESGADPTECPAEAVKVLPAARPCVQPPIAPFRRTLRTCNHVGS